MIVPIANSGFSFGPRRLASANRSPKSKNSNLCDGIMTSSTHRRNVVALENLMIFSFETGFKVPTASFTLKVSII